METTLTTELEKPEVATRGLWDCGGRLGAYLRTSSVLRRMYAVSPVVLSLVVFGRHFWREITSTGLFALKTLAARTVRIKGFAC